MHCMTSNDDCTAASGIIASHDRQQDCRAARVAVQRQSRMHHCTGCCATEKADQENVKLTCATAAVHGREQVLCGGRGTPIVCSSPTHPHQSCNILVRSMASTHAAVTLGMSRCLMIMLLNCLLKVVLSCCWYASNFCWPAAILCWPKDMMLTVQLIAIEDCKRDCSSASVSRASVSMGTITFTCTSAVL